MSSKNNDLGSRGVARALEPPHSIEDALDSDRAFANATSRETRRAAAFLLAGGVAASLNFGARVVLSYVVPYSVAIVFAFFVGLGTAFVLNRRYVFDAHDGPIGRQLVVFVVVNLLGLAQTLACSLAMLDYVLPALGWHRFAEESAHAVGIVVPAATSYVAHRFVTFRAPTVR